MKKWFIVFVILLYMNFVLCKSTVKNNKKKLNSLKKKSVKVTKSPLEEFSNLPEADYEFIKELDKQFKLYGDRLKIKIEKTNSTTSTKRNIDGELGYGYHQDHGQQFQFSLPKYMIYPYSQHDIPPAQTNEHVKQEHTIVDIVPSKSYEINESPVIYIMGHQQEYITQSGGDYADYDLPGHHPVPQQYAEPIIVLRIPGPTKYASHLQSLLQQYLEIRASQLIKILEESEKNQGNPHESDYQPVHHQQQEHHHGSHNHQQQQEYYPSVDQVYNYKKAQSQHETGLQQHQEDESHRSPDYDSNYHHQRQPQLPNIHYETQTGINNNYYHSTTAHYQVPAYAQHNEHHAHHIVQQSTPGYGRPTPVYGVPTPVYGVPTPGYHHHEHEYPKPVLQTDENNPRDTHTRVIFTDGKNHDLSTGYPLPSVTTPRASYISQPNNNYDQYDQNDDYQHLESSYQQQSEQPVVEITQRPFNYHAHRVKLQAKAKKRNTSNLSGISNKNSRRINRSERNRSNTRSRAKKVPTRQQDNYSQEEAE